MSENLSIAEVERRARTSHERAQERRVRARERTTAADYLCRGSIVVGALVVAWLLLVLAGVTLG